MSRGFKSRLRRLLRLERGAVMAMAVAGFGLFCTSEVKAASLLLDPTTPNIGAASGLALLSTTVSVTDTVIGGAKITGNVGVGPHGSLTLNNGGSITGTVFLDNSSTPLATSTGVAAALITHSNLTSAITDAENASSALGANAVWNQTFSGISTTTTITAKALITYIDVVGDISLANGNTLGFSATSSSEYFVVNVTGKLSDQSAINVTGIDANHLFINVLSTDSSKAIDIFNGGKANGILIATNGGVTMDGGGSLTGAIIGDGNSVLMQNGATINGDPSTAPVGASLSATPLPSSVNSGLAALGGLGLLAGIRRFRRSAGASF